MPGLDRGLASMLDYELALKRIKNDLQTDFIYAPHLNAIYYMAHDEIIEKLKSKLADGTFEPMLPVSIEVPKLSGFSRPGSILWPLERLAYQTSVDAIAITAETILDRSRVFSHVLMNPDPSGFMYKPSGECYSEFKRKNKEYAESGLYSHAIRADVASYFERLYQHNLVNLLSGANCDGRLVKFLEKLMLLFTEKNSHGIIQGVYPSDFLGTFYLCSLDLEHVTRDIPFTRYVDDIYAFFESEKKAIIHKVLLGAVLRRDGLNLNEAKTKIMSIDDFLREETEIDRMFNEAIKEISSELEREDFYSTTIIWDYEYGELEVKDVHEYDIELNATKSLFDYDNSEIEIRNKIERFCLPIFTAAEDEYAVDYVLKKYMANGHMAQSYARYLKTLIAGNIDIVNVLEKILNSPDLYFEFQLMWIYATLMSAKEIKRNTVNQAINNLRNMQYGEPLRATCAVFIGKFGDAAQRRILKTHYQQEPSPYVSAAILYSAKNFPANEKNTCFASWGGHSEVNTLVVKAVKRIEG